MAASSSLLSCIASFDYDGEGPCLILRLVVRVEWVILA